MENAFERGNLAVSGRGKSERVERQNNILPAPPIAQFDVEAPDFRLGDDSS